MVPVPRLLTLPLQNGRKPTKELVAFTSSTSQSDRAAGSRKSEPEWWISRVSCYVSHLGGVGGDNPISRSSYSLLAITATIGTGTQCPKYRCSTDPQPSGDFKEPDACP